MSNPASFLAIYGPHGHRVSAALVRRAWRAMSAQPNLSGMRLARLLGVSRATAYTCLHILKAAGYIAREHPRRCAWDVLIPFLPFPPAHPGIDASDAA